MVRDIGVLASKLDFLETIDGRVEIQIDVDSVGDKNAVVNVGEALIVEFLELLEE